jgi:C1A family cysteine protease
MRSITLALAFFGLIAVTFANRPHLEFAQFIQKYNKVYATQDEFKERFEIFQDNLATIRQLNKDANGRTLYGITKFADLTKDEFKDYKGYVQSSNPPTRGSLATEMSYEPVQTMPESGSLPSTFDWKNQGAVTPVKDQGQCGSCWAFSATEGSESAWFLAGHTLTELSPQEVVSCDTKCEGCNGCDLPEAFSYIESKGLETEQEYPYTSGTTEKNGNCEYQSSEVVAYITGWEYATQTKNETQMQVAMYQYGPLSICVDAQTWQFYRGGVITSNCGTRLDHCVQATGWNTAQNPPYWLIRNSWGASWGEQGYVWVEMYKDLCGVAEEATYVIGKK